MRKINLILTLAIAIFALLSTYGHGQGIAINTDGSDPNNSAMLDVKSSDKGLLIPRVTLNDASSADPISNPATGLLIYNAYGSEPIGFYHWDGSEWQKLLDAWNGDNDWTISGSDMYSAVSGNVGVGTTSPAFNFHILDGAPTLLIEASDEADAKLLFRDFQAPTTQNFEITHNAADQDLHISSDETEIMTFLHEGTVQIHDEIEYIGDNGNGSGANGMIQKNASSGRDELQLYADGDSYMANSKGAGIHLYGNYDSEHAGNVAFLTGNSGSGDARMIIAGGGGPDNRNLTGTKVTIGNSLWDWVDNENEVGILNIKDPSGIPAIYILGASTTEGEIAIPDGQAFNVGWWNNTTSSFQSLLEIDGTGNMGVGTTNPSAKLSVNGDANKPGGGNWAVFSDVRSKENIKDYNKGLAELLQLRPVSFKYKKEFNWGDETYVGLIAQEVEKVVPSMITEKEVQNISDFKEIDPNELTYMLINAIKELKAKDDILEAYNKSLETRIKALEARIKALESK